MRTALGAIVAMTLAGLSGFGETARAQEAMPLTASSAPPLGFLELCERTPEECVSDDRASAEQLASVRDWAARTRWSIIFSASGMASRLPDDPTRPAAAPSVIGLSDAVWAAQTRESSTTSTQMATTDPGRSGPKPAARNAKTDPTSVGRRAKAPPRKPSTSAKTRPEPAPAPPPNQDPGGPPPPVVADVPLGLLQSLNRRINRSIRRASDMDAFGRADVWVRPTGPRAAGDCEDYVLAKRRALIDLGVSPAALSIAVVRTRRGESHAVLLVATPEGERVMDNLSPWVLPWAEAPYEWLERQLPGAPLTWVRSAS